MEHNVGIKYAECIEACSRSHWFLEQAARKMLEPCNAALFIEGASPDHTLFKIHEALVEVETLWKQFKQARKDAA